MDVIKLIIHLLLVLIKWKFIMVKMENIFIVIVNVFFWFCGFGGVDGDIILILEIIINGN